MFVIGYPIPFPGAGWRRAYSIIRCLSRKFNVYVLSSISVTSLSKFSFSSLNGCPVFRFPALFLNNTLCRFVSAFLAFVHTFFLIVTLRISLLVVSIPPGNIGIGASIAALLLKRKLVIDYRDEYDGSIQKPLLFPRSRIYIMILRRTNLIVAVSKLSAIRLVKNIGKECKVTVIRSIPQYRPRRLTIRERNAVRKDLGFTAKDFIIVYVGHLGLSEYRIYDVIFAIKLLMLRGIRNVKLIIIGRYTPSEKSYIKKLLRKLGISYKTVKLLGCVSNHNRLSEIISSCDVGVIPFRDHYLTRAIVPMKFYEYCACNIPVLAITSEKSELAYIIKKYKLGLTVTPNSISDLVNKITILYRDRSFLRKIKKHVELFAKKYCNENNFCSRYIGILLPLLKC